MAVQNYSAIAKELWPLMLPAVRKMVVAVAASQAATASSSSGSSGSGDLATHGLNSAFHTGTLSNAQGPQFLLTDGTRNLTGNLTVTAGITIDGVDLSAHAADPDAHHDTATAGDGIEVTGQIIAVDLATDPGLEFSSGDLRVKIASSMLRGAAGIAVNEAHNFVWTGDHTFDNAQTIIFDSSTVDFTTGIVTFHTDPQVSGDLDFIGATQRNITAASHLYVAPTGDLWFDPTSDLIQANNDTEWRSQTIGDAPTGISGWRLWDRGGNESQLTITAIKADELVVRFFTADETRVQRGETYLTKSFGIVETSFTVPADEATVDVWFEAVPGLGAFDIFDVGDWLLCRTIDLPSGGLLVQKIWWTVDSWLANNTTTEGIERQQWRIKRESGGTTGIEVKKGNVFLDAGIPTAGPVLGNGWVHSNALKDSGGPFIQIGVFDSVLLDVPQFLNHVRMGNLNGTVDYGSNDAWGIAAGSNLGTTPSGGFSGFAADAENGLRLFNTTLEVYESAVLALHITPDDGLVILQDTSTADNRLRQIGWYDDLGDLVDTPRSVIGSYLYDSAGTDYRRLSLFVDNEMQNAGAEISLSVNEDATPRDASITLRSRALLSDATTDSIVEIFGQEITLEGRVAAGKAVDDVVDMAQFHVIENTAAVNFLAGMVIEQQGSGDSVLHWYLQPSTLYYSAGIDNSTANNVWKLSASHTLGTSDFIIVDPVAGTVVINGLDGGSASTGLIGGDGITLTGSTFDVDATVARTDVDINAGNGLTGGGSLAADRTLSILLPGTSGLFVNGSGLVIDDSIAGDGLDIASKILAVDSTVVRTSLTLTAGAGLTGGGDLSANRTFDIGAGSGITVNANDVAINLAVASGLNLLSGLALDDAVAGDGLTISVAKVLAVGAGDGITVGLNDVAVDASVVRTTRTLTAGDGLTGGGTLAADRTFTVGAGDGIEVGVDSVSVDATVVRTSRLISTSGALAGGGDLSADRTLSLTLGTNSGLNQTSGLVVDSSLAGAGMTLTAGIMNVIALATGGLQINANDVQILLPANSGLVTDATGLYVNSTIAGNGLLMTSGIIDVVAANASLTVSANSMNVNLAHAFAWTGVHTFADDVTFNDPVIINDNGTFNTGVFTFNTDPQVSGDLDFIGASRNITTPAASGYNISLKPDGDLILDPTGLITMPNAQEMKTSTFTDAVTGIAGFDFFDRGSNYRQLTLGALKVDEMYARVFVADETRIDRGEEYWSKSYGVVETDFVLPADEATVDVYFEDAPGLGAVPLFSTDDWILIRAIDWTTSMSIVKVWFQIVDGDGAGSNNWVSRDSTNRRQLWTLRRKSGGTTGLTIKKGTTALDAGQIGQGWIHLSALDQDHGPFIQMGTYTSVSSDVPVFTNRVRMGNLYGTVDYGSSNTWGFAAGDNLGTAPSAGFSGFTADSTNGLRLFNTEFILYEAGTKIASFGEDTGIVYKYDTVGYTGPQRGMYWGDAVPSPTTGTLTFINAYRDVNGNHLRIGSQNTGSTDVSIRSSNTTSGNDTYLYLYDDEIYLGIDEISSIYFNSSGNIQLGYVSTGGTPTDSRVHIFENTSANNATTGLTIENLNADGDSMLHFYHTNGGAQRWVLGTDRSDSQKFKISETAGFGSLNHLTITPTTGLITTSGALTVAGALIASSTLAVTSTLTASAGITMASGQTLTTETIRAVDATGLIFADDSGTGYMFLEDGGNVGFGISNPITIGHFYQSNASVTTDTGVLIEQGGTGDAVLRFKLAAAAVNWSIGADNSNGDRFHIAPGTDLSAPALIINPSTLNVGIGSAATNPLTTLDVRGNSLWVNGTGASGLGTAAGSGIRISSTSIYSYDYTTSTPNTLTLQSPGGAVAITGAATVGGTLTLGAGGSSIGNDVGGALYLNTNTLYAKVGATYKLVLNANGLAINNGSTGAGSGIGLLVASGDASIAGTITAAGINVGEDTLTVFDDGTWTTTLSGSTAPTVTYTTRYGNYQRLNNTWYIQASMTIATRSGGAGAARFALPATASASGYQTLAATFYDVSAGTTSPCTIEVTASTAYGWLYQGNTVVQVTDIAAGDIITYGGVLFA